MFFAFAAVIFATSPSDPPPVAEAVSTAPVEAATAAPRRAQPLGADRVATIAELETISLAGGAGAIEAIADHLEHWKGDAEMERHGHSALRRLPVDATSLANVIAADPSPNRRAWAAWTAGEHRTSAVADALLGALKDPDAKVRLRAVAALAVIGEPRAQDPILKIVVHDPDPSTRERAEQALAVLTKPHADPEPIEPVVTALQSTDVFQRLSAVKELAEKRPDRRAVGPVLTLLEKERDLEVRKFAISALAAMKDEIAVPALIAIAKEDHPETRLFAIGALALLDDSRAVEPLAALVRDPNFSVRRYSVRALAVLDRPGSPAPILRALDDLVPEVRLEACKALLRLSAKEGGDALAARLPREGDAALREFFAVALGDIGRVGDTAHENALLTLLGDDEPRVRAVAAGALGKIGTARTEKAILRMVEKEKKRKSKDLEVIRLGDDAARQVRGRKNPDAPR